MALLLVVQGLASLHLVLVPHSRCAQHGELVEGAAAHAATVAERGPATRAAPEIRGVVDDHDEGHEEHCVLSSLRAPSPAGARVGSLVAHETARVCAPEGTDAAKTSIPVVAIAPKSSPPSRASV